MLQGDLNLEMVRDFLKDNSDPLARGVYAKVVADGGVDDMMVVLADCLKEYLQTGITDNVIREQIQLYVES